MGGQVPEWVCAVLLLEMSSIADNMLITSSGRASSGSGKEGYLELLIHHLRLGKYEVVSVSVKDCRVCSVFGGPGVVVGTR